MAKWAWITAVLVAASWLLARARHDIASMLRELSWPMLGVSILLTASAKAGLVANARIAAARNGIQLGFFTCARLYNLSQLGKYLPGSIWQFVGRAAAYRKLGAPYGAIRDALLIESLWIVGGAVAAGAVFAGPGLFALAVRELDSGIRWWFALVATAMTAALLWMWTCRRPMLARYLRIAWPSPPVVLAQSLTWLLLGMAFWVLARACGLSVDPLFATGLFAGAYAAGFLVPFAPAGLGVRDGILTLGLLPYVPAGEALAVTVLARAIYLVVDVGLVVVQEPFAGQLGRKRGTTD